MDYGQLDWSSGGYHSLAVPAILCHENILSHANAKLLSLFILYCRLILIVFIVYLFSKTLHHLVGVKVVIWSESRQKGDGQEKINLL